MEHTLPMLSLVVADNTWKSLSASGERVSGLVGRIVEEFEPHRISLTRNELEVVVPLLRGSKSGEVLLDDYCKDLKKKLRALVEDAFVTDVAARRAAQGKDG